MVDLNEGASLRERARLRRGVPRARTGLARRADSPRQSRRLRTPVARAADGARRRRVAVRPRRVPRLRVARRARDRRSPTSRCAADSAKALRIAALCQAFEVPLMPHVWGTGINFCASLAVRGNRFRRRVGRASTYPLFEFDSSHNPLRDAFGSFAVSAGRYRAVPAGTRARHRRRCRIACEPYVTAQLESKRDDDASPPIDSWLHHAGVRSCDAHFQDRRDIVKFKLILAAVAALAIRRVRTAAIAQEAARTLARRLRPEARSSPRTRRAALRRTGAAEERRQDRGQDVRQRRAGRRRPGAVVGAGRHDRHDHRDPVAADRHGQGLRAARPAVPVQRLSPRPTRCSTGRSGRRCSPSCRTTG